MADIMTIPENALIEDINIHIDGQKQIPMVNAKQYDKGLRYIRATLWNDTDQYLVSPTNIVAFAATKNDGNPIYNIAGVDENGRIIYEITEQTTSFHGVFNAEFRIYNTKEENGETVSTLISTYLFKMNVGKSTLQDVEVISTPEFNALTESMTLVGDLVNDVNDALSIMNDVVINAETATINANTATGNANTATTNANNAASLANEKAILADNAANFANEKASLADTATTNANTATTNANIATSNAEIATTNAQNAADYANDVATLLDNETLKIYKDAVTNYADLFTTYPTPENGWTVTVTSESVSYRYNGTLWVNLGVIASVDIATDTVAGIVKGGGNVTIGIDGEMNVDLSGKINTTEKGSVNGVATLGEDGKVPNEQLPPISSDAEDITYDNAESGLVAEDVQGA
ncbi:MAG TPA: BppU family phage baseplate upper protein, partial [Acholeplasmataceae bacterium]|nr:BppU family phage baseplate upper protein [Acholeplasmataceae bacterium]